MAVPASVKRQAENATKIQESIIAAKGGQPAPAVAPDPASPIGDQPIDWEGRFKGLQKTHQTTAEDLKELRDNYDRLQGVIDGLKAAPPAPAEPATPEPPVFTPAEVKEYGQEFLEMVARVAGGNADSSIRTELTEVKTALNGFVEHQVQSAEDLFYAELDSKMPGWEQINASQDFKDWMAEEMPMTSQQRQKFLEAAHKRLDAKSVLDFFVAWKGESGGSYTPEGVTTPSQFVDESVDTDIYAASDVKVFYDEKARGKWKGREQEARQIELKIFKAQKEGRIR